MEDLESENGVVERASDWKDEALVPDGFGRTRVVGSGSDAVVRVDEESGVGFEHAVTPINVLEVLGGDHRDFEF